MPKCFGEGGLVYCIEEDKQVHCRGGSGDAVSRGCHGGEGELDDAGLVGCLGGRVVEDECSCIFSYFAGREEHCLFVDIAVPFLTFLR